MFPVRFCCSNKHNVLFSGHMFTKFGSPKCLKITRQTLKKKKKKVPWDDLSVGFFFFFESGVINFFSHADLP